MRLLRPLKSAFDAYTDEVSTRCLQPQDRFQDELSLGQFHGRYDLIITVDGDSTFEYRLAGHVETGTESFSDPALGGLVTLKASAEKEREEQAV